MLTGGRLTLIRAGLSSSSSATGAGECGVNGSAVTVGVITLLGVPLTFLAGRTLFGVPVLVILAPRE